MLDEVESGKDLKIGDYYRIKVSGINQITHSVSISQEDTMTTSELKLPSIGDFSIEAIAASLASVNFEGPKSNGEGTSADETQKRSPEYRLQKEEQSKFEKKVISAGDNLNKYNKSIFNKNKELIVQVDRIDQYYFDLKRILFESNVKVIAPKIDLGCKINNAEAIFKELNKIRDKQLAEENWKNFLLLENELRNILADVDTDDLTPEQKEQYKLNQEAFQELIKQKEVVLANIQTFDKSLASAKTAISGETWEKAMTSLSLIQNLQDTVYESLPMQYLGERSKVTISAVPRDPAYKVNSYSTTFVFPLEKVPYSGLSSSFYFSGLKSDVFSVKEAVTTDSTAYMLVNEEKKKQEIGTALLAKFGRKHNSWWGYHGSLGLGISFTDQVRPRVMVGGGMTFGTKNSLAIDVGFIGGQVDRISNSFSDFSDRYPAPPGEVTISKFDYSYFIGLGYFFRF